ncbi:MAG: ATP synthase F1 subunit delta [Chthonomonadales bacterium]|nr:ATP synthase F1 subunit delta [Chthonomonadales bacterium]
MSQVRDTRVTRRYARALVGAASRAGAIDALEHDLDALMQFWRSTPALQRALVSPLLPADRKRAITDQVLLGFHPLTRSFVHLLIEKRREEILPDVHVEVASILDERRGVLRAEATVAAPLDEPDRQALVAGLERHTGKRIALTVGVDPGLFGGVLVRMQDTVIDGSVRGAIEQLREHMLREA